jgi:archaeosortase B (VPXXXP-CTERM-specific)
MKKAKEKQIKDILLEEHKDALKTVSLFLILCFTFNFLYFKIAGEQIMPRSFTASSVALFLNLFPGLNAEANGTFVLMNGTSIDVIGECTGIFSIIVYISCILAYPTDLKKKAIGMMGIPILYGITLIRLISTALVGAFIPSLLDFFHDYLWQVFLIIFVVLLFLIWRDKVVEVK